jgi:hypothetical protein
LRFGEAKSPSQEAPLSQGYAHSAFCCANGVWTYDFGHDQLANAAGSIAEN